jgi:hypothetical protein
MKWMMLSFHAAATIEGIHPLDSGLFRRKYRRERRPGLPRENPLAFYGRYAAEIASKHWRILRMYLTYRRAHRRALEAAPLPGRDVATEVLAPTELKALELFTVTAAARSAVDKVQQRALRRAATLPALAIANAVAPYFMSS